MLFYRSVGLFSSIAIPFAAVAGTYLVVEGAIAPSALGVYAYAIITIIFFVIAASKYPRSCDVPGHEDVLFRLVRSNEEYCLVLRPFGRDGKTIMPRANRERHAGDRGFGPTVTLEQVVSIAVRTALGLETYGIVNQNVSVAPPGVKFMRASNDDWKMVAQQLIRRAHSIVLIVPSGQDIREGFAWEVEQIVRYRMRSRTLVVLPPCNQDLHTHRQALCQAYVLLALLEGSGRRADPSRIRALEDELKLAATTLVVRCLKNAPADVWGIGTDQPQKTVVVDSTYLSILVPLLREMEHELSEWSFSARYPRR